MRETITGVFGGVVLIVCVLSFALMRATLGDVSTKGEAPRAVRAAVAQLQVEGLRIERFIAGQVTLDETRDPFNVESQPARSEQATTLCNTIEERSKKSPVFATIQPTIVFLFDDKGVVVARNGSALMRGEKLGERHPEMLKAIAKGETGSEVWVDKTHNENWLVSWAPIREGAKIIGALAVGTAFNNERLQETSAATSQLPLIAAVRREGTMELVARSTQVTDAMLAGLPSAAQGLDTDQVIPLGGLGEELDGAAMALAGYGDHKQAVIVSVTPLKVVGSATSLLFPVIGVFLLGLVLTGVFAHLLDRYISQPISDLEDGLLAVINGQTDLRFELEHKVLGGLVFRVNSLLNQLLGVREDDTDNEGRPSISPRAESFSAALNVDERMASLSADDVAESATLKGEAPEDYYKRIFDEYLGAKRQLGDPVDHIKFAPFSQRIQSMETQLGEKHGKPFRYKVELKGKEVVFVAVPLA
jgi:hypothetical protein